MPQARSCDRSHKPYNTVSGDAYSAIAYAVNDAAIGWQGALASTFTTLTPPVGMSRLASAATGSTWLKRLAFYPARLSNAKLQAVTAAATWS